MARLHYILKRLNQDLVRQLTAAWLAAQVPDDEARTLDGKTLRGSYGRDLDEYGKPRDERPQQQLSAGVAAFHGHPR